MLIIHNAQNLIPSRTISNAEKQLVGPDRTIEINCATISKSDRKHANEIDQNTGHTSNTEKESSVNKNESLNMTNISSEENVSHSKALQPTASLGNDTDGNQEIMREQDQTINGEKNEATNVNSDNEQDDSSDSKGIPDDGNQNELVEEVELRKNKKETNIIDGNSTSLSVDD